MGIRGALAGGRTLSPLARSFGGVFVGAYDAFTASLAHVYEPARRTLTSYTGNLVAIRRASDDLQQNFGYVANGDLDTAAIAAWLGGSNGYVVSIYDQKNGDTITQADKTKQPLYVASAKNGHPGAYFDGGVTFIQGPYTNGGALSQPFSVFLGAQDTSGDSVNRYWLDGDDNVVGRRMYVGRRATGSTRFIYAGNVLAGGALNSNFNLWSCLFNGASSQFWINTVSDASGNAGAENPDGLTIGARGDGGNQAEGNVITAIICDPSLSDADRLLMQTAINSYWAVY